MGCPRWMPRSRPVVAASAHRSRWVGCILDIHIHILYIQKGVGIRRWL